MSHTLLIFPTHDGGLTWEVPTYRREWQISSVDLIDADNGWLFYADDEFRRHISITDDGGQSWGEFSLNVDYPILSRWDFVDSKVGWTLFYDESHAHSYLCKTLDGGITWACLTPRLQLGVSN
jgi:photosystem II stability/assembly factor-like uncharacterized protein